MSLTPENTHNQPPAYSVSDISGLLKKTVEEQFSYVRVRGEISGFMRAGSGHLYFSLKDDSAVLSAICWKGKAAALSFQPEDGLEVIATGRLSTYAGRSTYQIITDSIEIAGEGALMALLEKRKQQFAAEGLFAPERKQALPYLPRTIGIVTSSTGAVIRDILHRVAERFPTQVLLWPVLVQGEGAKDQITAAIDGFNAIPTNSPNRPDLLIIARGGGSIEDLWAFNEESVVRAAAASTIPLISAVGHETDTTLIDYVSDKRAPTPTGAAEMAVPVRADLVYTIGDYANRQARAIQSRLHKHTQLLQAHARGLTNPARLLEHATQRVDAATERLANSLPAFLRAKQQALEIVANSMHISQIFRQVQQLHERLHDRASRLTPAVMRHIARNNDQLVSTARLLGSLSHQAVLERGFALVRSADGTVLTHADSARKHAHLTLQFADGELHTNSDGIAPPPRPRKKPKQTDNPNQGTLF